MTDPHIVDQLRCLAARSAPGDIPLLQDAAELLEFYEDQNIRLLEEQEKLQSECRQLKDGYLANRLENHRIVTTLREQIYLLQGKHHE